MSDHQSLRVLTALVLSCRPELMLRDGVPDFITGIMDMAGQAHGYLFNMRADLRDSLSPEEYELVSKALQFSEIADGGSMPGGEALANEITDVLELIRKEGLYASGTPGMKAGEA